ncbi:MULTISPECIES: NPCBM/NEW2 domain-containing protein [Pontibacillus]|uniref:NPCBM/NEW2 domain-containing protein n=1 Tax=Pontibacillus chungwhensis TaxID=265426 RepID=A0ABY8UVQ9_9BACI|nr:MULTISPECIES: NPCBM/NEW2 domain-containing protein [Pontibacillus]MCD5324184.1 NPCBM/NEW2 domain-containing protein [Pontibacillus sp. HN14]WIF97757.1 NPCBM/NEW2 domain-containing protein [Pontibacillus chungwhensis]
MKQKIILALSLSSSLTLAACSSDQAYGKLMSQADQAMANSEVDQAIEAYKEVLEMDSEDLAYGESRHIIVEDLLQDATQFQAEMEELQTSTDEVKERVNNVEFSPDHFPELSYAYDQLSEALYQVDNYPNTKMYKDLSDLKESFTEQMSSKVAKPLLKQTKEEIDLFAFDQARESVKELRAINSQFPGLVAEEKLEEYTTAIDSKVERFIEFPSRYTERNVVLFESEEMGKITFLGEGMKDGDLTAIYKFEGGSRYIAHNIDLESRWIFDNGDYVQRSGLDVIQYPDYVIGFQAITNDRGKDLHRYDYQMKLDADDGNDIYFTKEDEYTTAELGEDKGTNVTKALFKMESKYFNMNYQLSDDEKDIEVNEMKVKPNKVTIKGKVTPHKDVDINEGLYVFVPSTDESGSAYINEKYFSGISKEFSLEFPLEETLKEGTSYVQLHLFGTIANISLEDGKELSSGEQPLSEQITYRISDYYYMDRYDRFFTDVSGNVYSNAITAQTSDPDFGNDESPHFLYRLSQKYSEFSMTLGVDQTETGGAEAVSEVTILADGDVLKKMTLTSGQESVPVKLNVDHVNELEFKIDQEKGEEGYQRLILGDGTLTLQ